MPILDPASSGMTLSQPHIYREQVDLLLDATPFENALLYGPPGTGKTESGKRHAIRRQSALETILSSLGFTGPSYHMLTAHAEASGSSIVGHWIPKGGNFEYHYNPGIVAFTSPTVLIINELDHYGEDASNVLHFLLDGSGSHETEDGVTHNRNPYYRCIATMNQWPHVLPAAILDRFTLRLPVLSPSDEAMATLPEDVREMCARLYRACDEKKPNPQFTFREMQSFSTLRSRGIAPDIAALAVAFSAERAQSFIEALAGR